ncbi:flagellar basal body P-ring protein FlgI [Vibrio barjaei]|uniref:flagellar basal body P-ring protein FlgI n=1 Tax=Vibrio barjaei TaxID=1676683 RepID=UPI002284B2BF|nr:flagellar basal body P-ring protein FlgI [Vibrio barjaei]MCY9872313.1 flagellar basal body P-ring protein FlgI [Vibrio barjaei]
MKKGILLSLALLCTSTVVSAARLGTLVDVYGDRDNQLIGYGLVVGLDGTGDKAQVKFTQQSVTNMLKQFGVQLSGGTDPKLKNVAAVTITAKMSPHHVPGQTIDATVSSIGDAKSLMGGTLIMTSLKGIDGEVYAVGQGNVIVGGYSAEGSDGSSITKNIPTVGRIPNGITIERRMNPDPAGNIVLSLKNPNYETANNISNEINKTFGNGTARAFSKSSIEINSPLEEDKRVAFLGMIQELDVDVGQNEPKIVFNSRTGTVVITGSVRVSRVAVSQGGLVVKVGEEQDVIQPSVLSGGTTEKISRSELEVQELNSGMMIWEDTADLQEIVDTVNSIGATPDMLMQILQAMDEADAIMGDLIII